VHLGPPPELALLHPRSLLAAAVLEVDREQHVAGREAVILPATPCAGGGHWRWWRLEATIEVPIDLERGVALGAPWLEVDEIAFDEELGPEVFSVLNVGDATRFRPAIEHRARSSRRKPHPSPAFPSACPSCCPKALASSGPTWMGRRHPNGSVGRGLSIPATGTCSNVRQGPAVAREADGRRGATVLRGGAKLHIGPTGTTNEVLVERSGHWSELHSDLPLDLLVAVALSIPAPS
jgi:hypothetical protein